MSLTHTAGRPPPVSAQAVARLLTEFYPFRSVNQESVKPLPSYDDRNYYFRGTLEAGDVDHVQTEFVLKLGNPLFSSYDALSGTNTMLVYLQQKGIKCIHPLLSRKKQDLFELSSRELLVYDGRADSQVDQAGLKFIIRVMTFIPGVLFDEVDKHFLTPDLVYDIGKAVGKMDTILQDFRHSGLEARVLEHWDLNNFMNIRQFLPSMQDLHKKELAETVLSLFEKHVSPKIPNFKKGIIYGDSNGLNTVLHKYGSEDGYSLAGFIDFGDSLKTCCVYEVGIMLAYAMLENDNPVEFAAPMLSGYLDAFPLSRDEVDSLYYLVLARCCQTAVLGEHQFSIEPWNDYLLTTPAKAWKLIEALLGTPKDEVDKVWAHV